MFFTFSVYPIAKVFQLGLFEWDGFMPYAKFVGLRNFFELFKDKIWWKSVLNAGYITFLALTIQNFFALILALFVDREIKLKKFYRVVYYIPPVLSGIVVGLVWNWILNSEFGILNNFLSSLGVSELRKEWLSNPKYALTSVGGIHMWKGFGWGFIILLAGLQGIPKEIYESAQVDGANEWQIFWRITFPLMLPVFFLVFILTILGTMQIYDIIVSTTGGGPGYHTEVPISRIVNTMIGLQKFGYACAMSIVFGILLLIISFLQIKLSKKFQV